MGREDWSWPKAIIGKAASITLRMGERLVFCGLDMVHVLSAFRHDHGIVFFLS